MMKIFSRSPKVFVIGLGKTGTTSMEAALKDLGYTLGDQRKGELLLNAWALRDFKPIIKHCKTAEAFQDVPFSLPFTYQALDQHFPNAKFILTTRDSADQWLHSLIAFHSKLYADGKRAPTASDLKEATYIYKGRPYASNRLVFNTPEDDLYNKAFLASYYETHIKNVQEYFRHSAPDKLITINVSRPGDYERMCVFLGKTPRQNNFPWENKT